VEAPDAGKRLLAAVSDGNAGPPVSNIDSQKVAVSTPRLPSRSVFPSVERRLLECIQMAIDIFAKLGDIKGESRDAKHKDEIDVLSYSWGVTNPAIKTGGSGGGTGKATFQDLVIVHKIDKASPSLLRACATGEHLKVATITQRKTGSGQQDFLIVKINDVIITGVVQGGSTAEPASETVSLVFAKVDFEYRPQKDDGSLDAGIHFKFDLKANKEG
jgi:type VI secretion system secreted protein Hcp